jgi:hypothetical protein
MKDSTKRIVDWLALTFLGLPTAVMWFDYVNNIHPSKLWIVFLIFDIPFAGVALIWLGWRFLSSLPKTERTKRIIDWLTLIPLAYMPVSLAWVLYTHNNYQPPTIWLTLLIIHFPFLIASVIWLSLRAANNLNTARWVLYGWLAIFTLLRLLGAQNMHKQTW